ncbi:hypothetical protein ACF5FK_004694 [Salmonella enterica]
MKKNILYEKLSKGCGFISVVGYFYPIFLAYVYLKTMSADDYKYFFFNKSDLQSYIDNYFKVDNLQFTTALIFGLLSVTFYVLRRKTE